MRAIEGQRDDGEQTQGLHVHSPHEAPTPPGTRVTVEVRLAAIEGRQLTFSVCGFDDVTPSAEATHRRAVIDARCFRARLRERRGRTFRCPLTKPGTAAGTVLAAAVVIVTSRMLAQHWAVS